MSPKKIISAIDIGSNSVILLLAECDSNKNIKLINEYFATTRLAENLQKNKKLSEDAMQRTLKALMEMHDIALKENSDKIILTASSAVRDAENRSSFLVKCHQLTKIYPQVLSGKEESKFAYIGATINLEPGTPAFLIDIGGGSTEIAYGIGSRNEKAFSLDLGCVRLFEMFRKDESFIKQASARSYIKKHLSGIYPQAYEWTSANNPVVLTCGGTATTYAAVLKRMPVYERDHIENTESSRKEIASVFRKISSMKLEQRIKLPGMEKDRAPILPTGLMIMHTTLKYLKINKIKVTANGLRMGIVKHYIDHV